MLNDDKLVANPLIILREEFDDWAILFDPESGNARGINPIGVFIWKRLDGKHTIEDIVVELQNNCEDVPVEAKDHVADFINDLMECGLAGTKL